MNFQLTAASGNVVIYAHAKGKPKAYEAPNMFFYYFVDYDAQGNLFMDGDAMDGRTFVFAKMPAGGTAFADIAVDHAFFAPGAVQWIGKTLLIGDQQSLIGPSGIFEFFREGEQGHANGRYSAHEFVRCVGDMDRRQPNYRGEHLHAHRPVLQLSIGRPFQKDHWRLAGRTDRRGRQPQVGRPAALIVS